jgi:hypothetical protein
MVQTEVADAIGKLLETAETTPPMTWAGVQIARRRTREPCSPGSVTGLRPQSGVCLQR